MIDEKLAKGYTRHLFRDLEQPALTANKAIQNLFDNYAGGRKGQLQEAG